VNARQCVACSALFYTVFFPAAKLLVELKLRTM
jgi:hypothetical protein